LRFDFSHPKPLTPDELRAIEAEVNDHLRRNEEARVRVMDRDAAIAEGAMALFGEKYGDQVRVVSMGEAPEGGTYSVELCGGTHVRRTGDIALFRIVSEGAVAAGVRRIEALTGEAAFDEARHEHELVLGLAQTLKAAVPDLPARLEMLVEDRRRLEREVADLRRKLATGATDGAGDGVKQIGQVRFAGRRLEGVPAKELRGTADAIKKQLGSGVVALVSVNEGKASVVVSVTDDLAGRLNAVDLLRKGVAAVGGSGGGGRPDFAQGGGPDGARAGEAIAAIEAGLAAA
jgi:alanyl-tRNA synthetase